MLAAGALATAGQVYRRRHMQHLQGFAGVLEQAGLAPALTCALDTSAAPSGWCKPVTIPVADIRPSRHDRARHMETPDSVKLAMPTSATAIVTGLHHHKRCCRHDQQASPTSGMLTCRPGLALRVHADACVVMLHVFYTRQCHACKAAPLQWRCRQTQASFCGATTVKGMDSLRYQMLTVRPWGAPRGLPQRAAHGCRTPDRSCVATDRLDARVGTALSPGWAPLQCPR